VKVVVNWQRRKSAFRYPGDPVPRTAVLEPWFAPNPAGQVRSFRAEQQSAIERFAPQAIAASWPRLQELARQPWLAPTHAVIVLSVAQRGQEAEGREFDLLSPEDRELLWRVFRVPIFEEVIGPRGTLLAYECAAHDGLHIEAPDGHWKGCLETSPCGCGLSTPRLLASRAPQPLRAIAAYAR
jgi:hypothetical protein